MGEERHKLKQWRKIALYCLSMMPDNADAWIVLGHIEFRLGWEHHTKKPHSYYEASKRAYRVAAKLKGLARTWIDLGLVCWYSGDREGQLYAFKAALEINPDNWIALWRLGQVLAESGQEQEAVGLLARAIEGAAEGACWIYVDLGMNALRLGEEAKAVDAFLQAAISENAIAFNTLYPQIAVSFYGHDQAAGDLHDRLSEINPLLAAQFFNYFQPHVGTVTYAKGYYRIKADANNGINYGDYFILNREVEAAGIPTLRVRDRVEFNTDGRRVLPKRFKLLTETLGHTVGAKNSKRSR